MGESGASINTRDVYTLCKWVQLIASEPITATADSVSEGKYAGCSERSLQQPVLLDRFSDARHQLIGCFCWR